MVADKIIQGLLNKALAITSPSDRKILKSLQSSVAVAALIKSDLIDGSADNIAMVTRPARDAIADVTNQLGVLAVTQAAHIGGADADYR
jgi:hypothetical protein